MSTTAAWVEVTTEMKQSKPIKCKLVGDLSMPLHNTLRDSFNRQHHNAMDRIVNDEVLDHLDKIRIYPIQIKSEDDLLRAIARIADLSLK
jgi:hypothetical protein